MIEFDEYVDVAVLKITFNQGSFVNCKVSVYVIFPLSSVVSKPIILESNRYIFMIDLYTFGRATSLHNVVLGCCTAICEKGCC